MGFFTDANEVLRRQHLKEMEDRRLVLAEKLRAEGFAPGEMVAVTAGRGGMAALCRERGQICLIVGPDFGGEGEFVLERYDVLPARKEEFAEPAEGLGGALGMGKKGSVGFDLRIDRPDGETDLPFRTNFSCGAVWKPEKNPLLDVKRRRKDANVVWDMEPVDRKVLKKLEAALERILCEEQRTAD